MHTFNDIRSPFASLRQLIDNIPPGQSPIDLTIGAPRHPPPGWVKEKLLEACKTIGSYPPITGSDALRAAIISWAHRRYPVTKTLLGKDSVLPLNGSREGLFYAGFMARSRRPEIKTPLILMPNPYYQVYGAAALAAGASPRFLNAERETGFLPDLGALSEETLQQTIAFYLCSPSNPEGAIASMDYLQKAVRLAQKYDFLLFSDECYSEIYTGAAPPSALEAAMAIGGNFQNVVCFNSLSKRSNVPGLRAGIIMGDPDFMAAFTAFRNVAAPQIPGPIQHAAAHLWQDEAHVEANRAQYRQKFARADQMLQGRYEGQTPAGGFFLWLNFSEFGGGINAVTTLWKDCGVKLLPGAFLSQQSEEGVNPGSDYARLALVGTLEETEEALTRIISTLG